MVLWVSGCAAHRQLNTYWESRENLIVAQKLFDRGDYEGALKENQKVLSRQTNKSPGDNALYNAGLIYAHPDYAKRDYQKSLDHFKKLVKAFPYSSFSDQGRVWISVLEKLNAETEESNRSCKKIQHDNERLTKEIEDLKTAIKKSKQVDIEIEGKKKELSK